MQAIRIIVAAAKAFYEEILFFLVTGAILLVATLLIIPLPFALAGVWMVAHRCVRGLGVNWRMYWDAVKGYGPKSLWLTLIILLGYALLLSNVWFYATPNVSPIPANISVWIVPIWILGGVIWTGATFYAYAFLIELEKPKLWAILRNSLSLTLISPLTTAILLIVTVLLTVLSIAVPLLLFALPGFIATLSITAVRTLIAAVREKYAPTEEESSSTEEGSSTD